ncbi:MAG: ethanolamine ammonia-lyase reactivating factor EutA [Clostridia bacterium]|nr:ethanolamine ammonia-lyase reactivating factor EutA [Clostridia bacterium]
MNDGILSVGIDIGTSTTQVIFSRIIMENMAGFFSVPHISIIDKKVVYKSDIYTTPLVNSYLIDGDKVRDIVADEFKKAGFTPADTQTGAVIITGESARKENSALVLEKLSDFAGEFVVSTAGPDLESVIAGKGSGAQSYSEENACVAVNLDIGGGTTNVVVFDCGKVVAKGCVDIGGRQIKLTPDYAVEYISPSASLICEKLGIDLKIGDRTDKATVFKICCEMAHILEQMLGVYEQGELLKKITTHGSSDFALSKPIRAICFSGGVADCIYNTHSEELKYGDIGVLLGQAIRQGRLLGDFKLIQAKETIRATVVGAGSYTTSISGSTISYSEKVLPLKNVPVLKLNDDEQAKAFSGDTQFIKEKINWFMTQSDSKSLVLAFKGYRNPSYNDIGILAKSLGEALDSVLGENEPMIIVTECDIAKALGQTIGRIYNNKRDIISIDSISVDDGDFVDLGKPLMDGLVIPVVVKTLIFG